jgi:1-aminocyclopropane-1-carboxylate deaminase/D-cysteine desulfhydrase-like pyridoxal-dependent ACC family enzyme
MASLEHAREYLATLPSVDLGQSITPVHELTGLRAALGGGPRLLIKRDDLLGFAFGGNKVRKLALVAARARDEGADTLVTTGGVQSNHARVTAAVAARLGMRCALVLNGRPPDNPTGNARLVRILGAEVHYVGERAQRSPAMGALVERLTDEGHRPFMIPLGASTPLGALAYARAFFELLSQVLPPDAIVHSTSSGGTQAGLVAGVALAGVRTRVLGISADDPPEAIGQHIGGLLDQIGAMVQVPDLTARTRVEIDDRFVGDGYGIPTPASQEAVQLLAGRDGVFLDPTYTAKAMAGLVDYLRAGRFRDDETVLFWHTGGLPGLFA